MLSDNLQRFNTALKEFQEKFPRPDWSLELKHEIINDFSFFSSKIEDEKLDYGDTIKFLNDEFVGKERISSLLEINNHKNILEKIITRYDSFELTEDSIKSIHSDLMGSELSWNNFDKNLVGEYRKDAAIGFRLPLYPNKSYVSPTSIEMVMASNIDLFNRKFDDVDNSTNEKHILTALAYFHNIFLNKIHPFADGNGRVCRIIMGTFLMKNDCPPVFIKIKSDDHKVEYINKIIECESENSDTPLVEFLANGMAEYLEDSVSQSKY